MKQNRIDPAVLSPHNLPYRMRLLVQLFGRQFQQVLNPFDLTPLHWGILSVLWQEDGLRTQTIAERLEQLGGTLTVGLDSMEMRGLVKRKADLKDRRVSRVWLRPRGADLQQRLVPEVSNFVAEIFSCLSAAEQKQLSQLVEPPAGSS